MQERRRLPDSFLLLLYMALPKWLFEVEDFVRSTRRWLDRGNPRDAGEWYACRIIIWLSIKDDLKPPVSNGRCFSYAQKVATLQLKKEVLCLSPSGRRDETA